MPKNTFDDKSTLFQVKKKKKKKNIRQQAITWANVEKNLCRHMASVCHNELMIKW